MDVLNIYIVTGYTLYECTGTLQPGYIRLGRDTSIAGERGERQSEDYHLFSRRPKLTRNEQSKVIQTHENMSSPTRYLRGR